MLLLTEDARVVCKHENGAVQLVATQKLVTINRRRILVERDPEGRSINGCPMYGPAIKPCTTTLAVQQGYSTLLRIQSHRVCLDTVSGLTDGTPPGTVRYEVRQAGQQFVKELS